MYRTLLCAAAALSLMGGAGASVAATNTDAPAAPRTAMDYMAKAGASDLYEIQSSQAVLETTRSDAIRSFANMMVADHTKTTQDVNNAAQSAGLTPPPAQLDPDKTAMLSSLQAASGADRDKLYVRQQQLAHRQALMLHSGYAKRGDTPALKAVAASAVPIIQHHAAEITRIANSMK